MVPAIQVCEMLVEEQVSLTYLFSATGVFRGGHDLLVRSRLVLTDTVTMQVTGRSGEELPVDVVMASVG